MHVSDLNKTHTVEAAVNALSVQVLPDQDLSNKHTAKAALNALCVQIFAWEGLATLHRDSHRPLHQTDVLADCFTTFDSWICTNIEVLQFPEQAQHEQGIDCWLATHMDAVHGSCL